MTRTVLVVAALLLINLGSIAAAAEYPEHKHKNAHNILATLDSVGINNKKITEFVSETDTHIDHGYFYLAEQKAMGGNCSLRYQLGDKLSAKQLELRYTPNDSNFQLTARSNLLMVTYHLEFSTVHNHPH